MLSWGVDTSSFFIYTGIMLYDNIIIDSVNLAYKTFGNFSTEPPKKVQSDLVYKKAICSFVHCVEDLKKKYLSAEGHIYLLFDNYFSRTDLQNCFQFADRKELNEKYKSTRKKEARPFYNSLNLLRYYYIIAPDTYRTVRILQLEADDLVKPVLELYCKPGQKNLLVTSDMDWCKNLNQYTDWLPKLGEEPETMELMSLRMGFSVSEVSIILYKAIFGDPADNIKSILPENSVNKTQFQQLVKNFSDPYNIISFTRDCSYYPEYPMLSALNTREKDLLINIQLVDTIKCDKSYVKRDTIVGSNQKTKFTALRRAVGLETVPSTPSFGKLKASRA